MACEIISLRLVSSFSAAALELRLGQGEISATLSVSGVSEIRETSFPGVWWTRHADESGRVVALLIEVAEVPDILRANREDMRHGQKRLSEVTNFAHARPQR